MEESGIVSIWLGSFESREALAAYAENRFMQNENGEKVPSFTQDFFNGDLWPVSGGEEENRLCAALTEVYSKGFDQPYNAVIAVYDYQFEGSRYVPGAPARFVGSFSYIER